MKKNKKQLRLEDALVPVEEQPYEVPKNWCWTKLGVTISISKEKTDDFSDTSVKYVGLEHLESNKGLNGYGTTEGIKSLKNIFHTGQILYGKLRPYLNKHDIASFDGVCSTDILVIDVKNVVDAQFVNKFLDMDSFISYTVNNSKGINLPRVSGETIMDAAFPLPPLPEQQRIVERIESLFSKLDEAKEKVEEVAESSEIRRNVLLHKAFSGELTKNRRDREVNNEQWEHCKLSDVYFLKAGKSIKANEIKSEKTDDSMYPCFGGNGIRGYVSTYNREGDYPIIGRQGALCGNVNFASGKFYATEHAVVVEEKRKCSVRCSLYYLEYLNLNQYATSVAQPGLAVRKINEVIINYIPYEEQCIIADILDDTFQKNDKMVMKINEVLQSIDLMKKTILAKAFRGELGTNNPDEESSVGLLNNILDDENK